MRRKWQSWRRSRHIAAVRRWHREWDRMDVTYSNAGIVTRIEWSEPS